MEQIDAFVQTAIQMGTPLLFATLGGILCEKVGNLNLGVEGMMLLGAVMGFITGVNTGNVFAAVFMAGFAGLFGALLYAIVTVTFRGNQTVTGLALTIFGTGISSFFGKSLSGIALPESIADALAPVKIEGLTNIPFFGDALFGQSIYVYLGMVMAIIVFIYIKKTRFGLNMRMVGENPGAADASGINVSLYKYVNILLGGLMCGLAGGYYSLAFVPRWQENITAGAGWIAVALVIFCTWSPIKAIFGAYFFGALRGIGFKLQNVSFDIFGSKISFSPQLLDMIPYIATIVVLVMITMRNKKEDMPPKGLSAPYFREDR